MLPPKGKKYKKFRTPVPGEEVGFWTKLMYLHYLYNLIIVIIGVGLIIWGGWMIINGINGEIDWIIKLFGNESTLLNATPGTFLIVVGLLILLFVRSKVDYRK
jgi:hypothetical protein